MFLYKDLKKITLFLALFSFTGASLAAQKPAVFTKYVQVKPVSKEHRARRKTLPVVTIWIHGTCIPFGVRTFHAPSKLGMYKAIDLVKDNKHLHHTASLLAKKDPERFSFRYFYFFGWSGELGFNEREKSSALLYEDIKNIIQEYKIQYGRAPKIRLVCHSHGGNVALHLAQHAAKDNDIETPKIDELVLLGCPIQAVTKDFAHHSTFKRVYNIYSTMDLIQILDPQGIYEQTKNHHKLTQNKQDKFFSGKKLPAKDHIIQGYVRISGRPVLHAEFIMTHFVEALPELLATLDESFVQRENKQVSPNAIYALSIKKS